MRFVLGLEQLSERRCEAQREPLTCQSPPRHQLRSLWSRCPWKRLPPRELAGKPCRARLRIPKAPNLTRRLPRKEKEARVEQVAPVSIPPPIAAHPAPLLGASGPLLTPPPPCLPTPGEGHIGRVASEPASSALPGPSHCVMRQPLRSRCLAVWHLGLHR